MSTTLRRGCGARWAGAPASRPRRSCSARPRADGGNLASYGDGPGTLRVPRGVVARANDGERFLPPATSHRARAARDRARRARGRRPWGDLPPPAPIPCRSRTSDASGGEGGGPTRARARSWQPAPTLIGAPRAKARAGRTRLAVGAGGAVSHVRCGPRSGRAFARVVAASQGPGPVRCDGGPPRSGSRGGARQPLLVRFDAGASLTRVRCAARCTAPSPSAGRPGRAGPMKLRSMVKPWRCAATTAAVHRDAVRSRGRSPGPERAMEPAPELGRDPRSRAARSRESAEAGWFGR